MASDKTINQLDQSSQLSEGQLFLVADPNTGKMFQASVAQLKTFIGEVSGANGKSAYQLAVDAGFAGTVQQWLDSLKGEPGEPGESGGGGAGAAEGIEYLTMNNYTNLTYNPIIPIEHNDDLSHKVFSDPIAGDVLFVITRCKEGSKGKIDVLNPNGYDIAFTGVVTPQTYPVGIVYFSYECKKNETGALTVYVTCLNPIL